MNEIKINQYFILNLNKHLFGLTKNILLTLVKYKSIYYKLITFALFSINIHDLLLVQLMYLQLWENIEK